MVYCYSQTQSYIPAQLHPQKVSMGGDGDGVAAMLGYLPPFFICDITEMSLQVGGTKWFDYVRLLYVSLAKVKQNVSN